MNELVRRLQKDVEDGHSQRWIAHRAGVSDATIRKILAGGQTKHDMYQKLADNYFKVPVEEVYRMAGILPSMYTKNGALDRGWLMAELWKALNQLTDAEKLEIYTHIIRLHEQREKQDGD